MKKSRAYKYLVAAVNDAQTEIQIEFLASPDAPYSELYDKFAGEYKSLPKYIVVNHAYQADGLREKVVFINWIPETSPIRKKMIQSASKNTLKQKLDGVHFEIQGNDLSDVIESNLTDKAISLNKN